ncbi:MAG TPA: peptide chain release factor N(5)-glutamine methyltransferase [Steroidobacteraceae bacterium]|nr:peptide chain release factor N(5)-glutamine methyltransferase [Steroidobacteraceae bacterium]
MSNDVSSAGAPGAAGNVADCPTVAALLDAARARGIARLDAEVLLAALSRMGRAQLFAFGERPVDPLTASLFEAGLERLAAGEPLAYITGVREFWSMPLVVTPDVLIPRPETELLVERCLQLLDAGPRVVADLGTGSGAIALALARERPAWRIVATDASPAALEVAAMNRQRLQLGNVELRAGRWCDALPPVPFDAILSNPPYIAAGDAALEKLGHEPRAALVAGPEGLDDLRRIVAQAPSHLRDQGWLLLEHGADQAPGVAGLFDPALWLSVRTHADLAGLPRVTEAQYRGAATQHQKR